MKHLSSLCLLFSALLGTACTTSDASSSANPVAPSGSLSTEAFSGTVDVGGSDSHTFSVVLSGGQLNVILTAAGPPTTIYMGLGIGTPAGGSCSLLSSSQVLTQAGTTAQLSGTANAGTYCVAVFDAGNQTAQIAYSLTVTHY
jgi:hypothetical protein